jgi:hypothetical protein
MSITEMLNKLIEAGHVVTRNDDTQSVPFGSYRQVPSVTVYGNGSVSAMMTDAYHAKLEQHSSGN